MITEEEATAALTCWLRWLDAQGKDFLKMKKEDMAAELLAWDREAHDELHEYFSDAEVLKKLGVE